MDFNRACQFYPISSQRNSFHSRWSYSLISILITPSHSGLVLQSGVFLAGYNTTPIYAFLFYPCMPHVKPDSPP
jgi:hypothetical protein